MKNVFLVLAFLGAVVPYSFFIQHFKSEGFGPGAFVGGLFANGAAGGFSADLLISSLVFWLAMFQQRREGKGPRPGVFILLNLVIGLSCALPAYLYYKMGGEGK